MSGTAAVGNTFASAVTATGLQLDNNFSTVVAYLNDPTNRNNYASDSGTTNTVVLTFAPPVVGGYTAGLELAWKWAQTNTGGVVLNANGLGNVSVVNPDGTPLQPGQGVQGSIGKGVYDGTRIIFITPPFAASQSQMEMTTGTALYVSPARQIFHPGTPKAWAVFNGTATGTITPDAAYNIAQVVRSGTGTYGITFGQAFSSPHFAVFATNGAGTSAGATGYTSAGVTIISRTNGADAPIDQTRVQVICFGDLP